MNNTKSENYSQKVQPQSNVSAELRRPTDLPSSDLIANSNCNNDFNEEAKSVERTSRVATDPSEAQKDVFFFLTKEELMQLVKFPTVSHTKGKQYEFFFYHQDLHVCPNEEQMQFVWQYYPQFYTRPHMILNWLYIVADRVLRDYEYEKRARKESLVEIEAETKTDV